MKQTILAAIILMAATAASAGPMRISPISGGMRHPSPPILRLPPGSPIINGRH